MNVSALTVSALVAISVVLGLGGRPAVRTLVSRTCPEETAGDEVS